MCSVIVSLRSLILILLLFAVAAVAVARQRAGVPDVHAAVVAGAREKSAVRSQGQPLDWLLHSSSESEIEVHIRTPRRRK